jgi:ABC-2 type transport system permease protein
MSAIVLQDTWTLLRRWLIHLRRDSMSLSIGLIQPLTFLLFGVLFREVFRGGGMGADASMGNYPAFFAVGVVVFTMLVNAFMGGIPIVFDRETGFMDKILASPVSRSAIVLSRFAYVTFFSLLQAFVVLGVAWVLLGIRFASPLGTVLAVIAYGTLLSAGISAISLACAFLFPHHSMFFAITGFLMTPVLVLSSAFVPIERMPGWMELLARMNPLTHAIQPIRAMALGDSTQVFYGYGGHAVALIAFDLVCLALAVRVVKKRLD